MNSSSKRRRAAGPTCDILSASIAIVAVWGAVSLFDMQDSVLTVEDPDPVVATVVTPLKQLTGRM